MIYNNNNNMTYQALHQEQRSREEVSTTSECAARVTRRSRWHGRRYVEWRRGRWRHLVLQRVSWHCCQVRDTKWVTLATVCRSASTSYPPPSDITTTTTTDSCTTKMTNRTYGSTSIWLCLQIRLWSKFQPNLTTHANLKFLLFFFAFAVN